MMTSHIQVSPSGVLTHLDLLDELLEPHRVALGKWFWGYRAHCYRLTNFARLLTADAPGRDEKLAIVAVWHDLPFMLTGDLDYLGPAADRAVDELVRRGREDWAEEVRLMIAHHHQVRRYVGPHAELVDATRRADWIDVSFTRLRFGIPRSTVREVAARFPFNEAYRHALGDIARYAVSHPRRPLPMVRW